MGGPVNWSPKLATMKSPVLRPGSGNVHRGTVRNTPIPFYVFSSVFSFLIQLCSFLIFFVKYKSIHGSECSLRRGRPSAGVGGGFLHRQSLQETQMQPGIFQRLEAQGRSAGGRAEKSWHPRGRISSIFGGKRQVLLDHKLDPQKEHSFEESLV